MHAAKSHLAWLCNCLKTLSQLTNYATNACTCCTTNRYLQQMRHQQQRVSCRKSNTLRSVASSISVWWQAAGGTLIFATRSLWHAHGLHAYYAHAAWHSWGKRKVWALRKQLQSSGKFLGLAHFAPDAQLTLDQLACWWSRMYSRISLERTFTVADFIPLKEKS